MEFYGTIGPACAQPETLQRMVEAGMTGIRMNLSHGPLSAHKDWLDMIHAVGIPQLLIDLQGPELRIGTLTQTLVLEPGQSLRLGQGGVPCPAALVQAARPGQNLLLDDGRLLVQVAGADGAALQCTVVRGGTLQSRKSLAAPGLAVASPTLTEADLQNLQLAGACGVTGVMLPFVRGAEDIRTLRRALEQADGLDRVFAHHITNKSGKYIVFCANKEHMDEMVSHVPEWFAGVNPDVAVYEAYSDDPNTDKAFADFKTDTSNRLKLLFCIDMLNEGVHVEGISGVILFRPTISPIIYKQQIGRTLTAGDNTTPLILDVVNNFEGLTSISGLQSEMQEAVHRLYANGEGDKIVTERFEVIEQVHDCRVLFERLQASLSSSWDHYFSEASIYYIVINADDYYGKEGFKAVHEYLVNGGKSCMAGFVLKNTLSDNGGVTRGICKMDENGNLTEVVETKNIVKTADGAEADGVVVDVNSLVSMNMWGLTPEFLDVLEEGFKEFFEKEVPSNPQKAEYLIPIFIGELLEQGKMSVKVLKTNDTWYGMTYHEDVTAVKNSFKKMLENGVYKADLFTDL